MPEVLPPAQISSVGNLAVAQYYMAPEDGLHADPRESRNLDHGYIDTCIRGNAQHLSFLDETYAHLPLAPGLCALLGLPEAAPMSRVVARLYEKNQGLFVIGKATYMNFLEYMSHAQTARQQVFEQELPALQADYLGRVEKGVRRGDLPTALLDTAWERVPYAKVLVDDGFRTHAEGTDGEYIPKQGIILGPRVNPDIDEDTLLHEYSHLNEVHDPIDTDIRGMKQILPDYPCLTHALREAIITHVTAYLLNGGDIADTHPLRPGRANTYIAQRFLLNALCHITSEISIQDFLGVTFDPEFDTYELELKLLAAVPRRHLIRLEQACDDEDEVCPDLIATTTWVRQALMRSNGINGQDALLRRQST